MNTICRFFILILLLPAPLWAAGLCKDLFKITTPSATVSMSEAIHRGLEIFDRDPLLASLVAPADSFIHGSTVENIKISLQQGTFSGTSPSHFKLLYGRYRMSTKSHVVHAYPGQLESYAIHYSLSYAELAAQKYFIAEKLNIKPNPTSNLLSDLAEVANGEATLQGLIDLYRTQPTYKKDYDNMNYLKKNIPLTHIKEVLAQASQRRGVLVIFKNSVKKSTKMVDDPEDRAAVVLHSAKGIPAEDIYAIIPLSSTERRELGDLL